MSRDPGPPLAREFCSSTQHLSPANLTSPGPPRKPASSGHGFESRARNCGGQRCSDWPPRAFRGQDSSVSEGPGVGVTLTPPPPGPTLHTRLLPGPLRPELPGPHLVGTSSQSWPQLPPRCLVSKTQSCSTSSLPIDTASQGSRGFFLLTDALTIINNHLHL